MGAAHGSRELPTASQDQFATDLAYHNDETFKAWWDDRPEAPIEFHWHESDRCLWVHRPGYEDLRQVQTQAHALGLGTPWNWPSHFAVNGTIDRAAAEKTLLITDYRMPDRPVLDGPGLASIAEFTARFGVRLAVPARRMDPAFGAAEELARFEQTRRATWRLYSVENEGAWQHALRLDTELHQGTQVGSGATWLEDARRAIFESVPPDLEGAVTEAWSARFGTDFQVSFLHDV